MSSTSKSQQRLMGMVHAYQKGDLKTKDMDKELVSKIKKMANHHTQHHYKHILRKESQIVQHYLHFESEENQHFYNLIF